jgi:hypothetical protein
LTRFAAAKTGVGTYNHEIGGIMRAIARYVFLSVASVTALGCSLPAWAQSIPEAKAPQVDQSSDDRDTSYDPVGARIGSFMVYPKIEGGVTYNDNIYAVANKTNDFIGKISPSVDIRGDLGIATAALRGSLDRYQYFSASRESRTDWSVGANTSIEAKRGTFIYGAGGFTRTHEDRGDPNSSYTDQRPTEYNLSEVGGGFSTSVTRLQLGLDASYRYYDYINNLQQNGVVTNNQDRDRGVARVAGRVGFEFSPGYSLLARGTYESVNYRLKLDDAGFDRKSHGWRGTLGVNFALSHLLDGEVWGGYLTRSYEDARFSNENAAVFGAALTWHPSQMTKVKLNADRNVIETVTPGYRGFLSTTVSLGVEHELLRNVTLSAEARYWHDQYLRARVTVNPERHDNNYGASAAAKYIITRNIYTKFTYDWSKRTTDVNFPGIAFSRNRVTAAVGLQF